MRSRLLLVVTVTLLCLAATTTALVVVGDGYDELFALFKQNYRRRYQTVTEESHHRSIFAANMKKAARLQLENPLATFGVNRFADVSEEEFKATHHSADFRQHLSKRKSENELLRDFHTFLPSSSTLNSSKNSSTHIVDWRKQGAVTPVKDQHKCGGCWSFATTGNVEGQWKIAGNPLISLSEEQLLSCDTNTGNSGCDGGIMEFGFEWLIQDNHGHLDTEVSYPFSASAAKNGTVPSCQPQGRTVGATITSWLNIPQSEELIAHFIFSKGPASIGVDGSSFQTYKGGILTNCQDLQLDHAVLIVGFDEEHTPPYWIIKNSWGTTWGEEGYIRVEKGTNQCGLKNGACSALVGGAPMTPQPPTPPPTPQPELSGKNYSVDVCTLAGCQACVRYTFLQGQCIDEVFNGNSFKLTCLSPMKANLQTFVDTQSCNAWYLGKNVDTDTCLLNYDKKTYLKFYCDT